MKKLIFLVLMTTLSLLCACTTESVITLSSSLTGISLKSTACSSELIFSTNSSWVVTSSDSWLTASPTHGEAGENIVLTVSASANPDYESRTATVTISAGESSQIITVTQTQRQGFLLSESNFSIGSDGGNITIPVQANIDYACAVNDNCKDWITISQTKSLSDYQLVISVAKNNSYDMREGSLEIAFDEQKETIFIRQSQQDEMIVSTKAFEIGNKGGEIKVPISTNIEYEAEVLGSANDWISVTATQTRGLEDCLLILNVTENQSYDGRVGQVKVVGAGKESFITITQNQQDELVVSQTSFEIGSDGGIISIPVATNCEYTHEILGNAQTWLSLLDATTKGLEDYTIKIKVEANDTYENRVGQIKIAGAGKESVVTIAQTQNDELIVGQTAFEIGSNGGEIKVSISTNIEYGVELLDGADAWLAISDMKTKGLEEHILTLIVSENKSYDGRVGQIRVAGSDKESIITITQNQLDELIVSQTSFEIGSKGGLISIPVSTNCDYTCEIMDNAQTWLSILNPVTKGLADYTVKVEVKDNDSYDSRVGQIKIVGAGKLSVITITQGQFDEMIVGQTMFEIGYEGGEIIVPVSTNVQFNCEIGAQSEWITVETMPTKGLIDYSVILKVAENKTCEERVGQVKITGANKESVITISQKNKPLEYQEFSFEKDGVDAVVAEDGTYALLKQIPESTDYIFLDGTLNESDQEYMLIDENGYVKALDLGNNNIAQVFYAPNALVIFDATNGVLGEIPYSELASVDKLQTRASYTRSRIFQAFKLKNEIKDWIKSPIKAKIVRMMNAMIDYSATRYEETVGNIIDLVFNIGDIIEWLELLDKLQEASYFGNAKVTALDAIEKNISTFVIPCQVEGFHPKFENTMYLSLLNYKLTLGLDVKRNQPFTSESYSPQKEISGNGLENFELTFLELGETYFYEPHLTLDLEVLVQIDEEHYRKASLALPCNMDEVKPYVRHNYCTIYGDKNKLVTKPVSSKVEKVNNVANTMADVVCTFSDVPVGADCFVKIQIKDTDKYLLFDALPHKKEQTVKVTGLTPNTSYTASTVISYLNTNYPGTNCIEFSTSGPSGSVEEVIEVSETSAVVKCNFKNVAEVVQCGILVKDEDGEVTTILVPNTEGEQQVTILGLDPSTKYTCNAFVQTAGYNHEDEHTVSFTTNPPDISGTWHCVETYYGNNGKVSRTESYTLILKKNGEMERTGDSTTYIFARWGLNTDGTFSATGYLISTQTQDAWETFNGKVNNKKQPTVITGKRLIGFSHASGGYSNNYACDFKMSK